jgi:hypothetical protein
VGFVNATAASLQFCLVIIDATGRNPAADVRYNSTLSFSPSPLKRVHMRSARLNEDKFRT